MRIALAQLNPTSGDIDGEHHEGHRRHRQASARGADLLVTPEMAIPATASAIWSRTPGSSPPTSARCSASPPPPPRLTVIVGFIDHDPTARNDSGTMLKYNAAAVVSRGRVLQRAHKSLLPNYRYFDDKRYFAPARRARPGRRHPRWPVRQAGRLDLRGHVGRVLRRQAAAGAGGEGCGPAASTSTRRPSTPASGTSATRSSASTSRGSASRSST